MNNIITQDVCEVFLKDNDTGNVYFFGLTSKNDVTQKVKQEHIKAGIGNGIVATISSDKEMTVKVDTAIHSDSVLAIQSGEDFTNGAYAVTKNLMKNFASNTVELDSTEMNDVATGIANVFVMDISGKMFSATYTPAVTGASPSPATVAVTGTGFTTGDCTIIYLASVTGDILSLDSKKFPKNFHLEMHTIAYDMTTNKVACDIYWIFEKALPDGNFTANYEAGKNVGDSVTFSILKSLASSEYGKYVVVPRA